jgi:hypothetical protein
MTDTDTCVFYFGKAGSSTVIAACESLGYHCSRAGDALAPEQAHYKYVISLAREPVARNVSTFFNDISNELGVKMQQGKQVRLEDLKERFLHEWSSGIRPLVWFQACFGRELGIDVYADKFPKRKGWKIYEAGRKRVLVIRTEDLTKKLGKALSELYGLEETEWPVVEHRAKGHEKYAHGVGDVYARFLDWVTLPESYLDKMYKSQYAEHFWSKAALNRFRKRWMGG